MTAGNTYALSSWVFLRVLGFIYLCAFASLGTQVRGLIGSRGLIPALDIPNHRRGGGLRRILGTPTLLWINSSDELLSRLCWAGAVLSLLLMFGVAPLPMLVLLW